VGTGEEVAAWRSATASPSGSPRPAAGGGDGELLSLEPTRVEGTTPSPYPLPQEGEGRASPSRLAQGPEGKGDDPIEQVIRRRGSSRRFTRGPISRDSLAMILARALGPLNADFRPFAEAALTDPYVIVNAVDGLESGAYGYERDQRALLPLKSGEFRDAAGYLALGQSLAGDAAVNVYFLAGLDAILPRLGNRGYRAAQLDASISAGRIYLAAYALGLGATGLTFFDDDVTRFFSPHAAGKSVMFLIALGKPLRAQRN
jgi:SagB-type dehydrogenase family enzyme